jgi:hypothetical protein
MGRRPLYVFASIFGILFATSFNFLGSKYVAFSSFFEERTRGASYSEGTSAKMGPRSYTSD